jgi:hypothetical protein
MAMMAKVVLVAEACPFEQLQLAPALVKARIAICMALEPNFWWPVDAYVPKALQPAPPCGRRGFHNAVRPESLTAVIYCIR